MLFVAKLLLVTALLVGAMGTCETRIRVREALSAERRRGFAAPTGFAGEAPDDCKEAAVRVGGEYVRVYCSWHDGTYVIESDQVLGKGHGITYGEAVRRFVENAVRRLNSNAA